MSLRDAFTAIQREHRFNATLFECSCQYDLPDADVLSMDRAEHEVHVSGLQIAYLREHLAQHAEELGLQREWAAAYPHDDLVTGDEDFVRDEINAHGGSLVTRFVTDWSRADD